MLYLIGLGLNEQGISKEGLLALEKCGKVYLENYTVDFPYPLEELKLGKKRIIPLERKDVESNMLIKEAKGTNVALLVYGCPLFATTHVSLILDAREQDVRVRVIYSASVFDAVACTGLELYKFGKITSMPKWNSALNGKEKKYEPDSFIDVIKDNLSIKAHSLVLVDIGLGFLDALIQLEKACKNKNLKLEKIIVCSQLGSLEHENEKIYYDSIENLKKLGKIVKLPFCLIIPASELHFMEKEALERLEKSAD